MSMFMIVYIVVSYFTSETVSGWASLAASIWFLGGAELVGIGVVGEYTGRAYMESKRRPRYFIEDSRLNGQKKADIDMQQEELL